MVLYSRYHGIGPAVVCGEQFHTDPAGTASLGYHLGTESIRPDRDVDQILHAGNPTDYRGKTFVVELYDLGDAQNNVSNIISFEGPDGSTWTGGCRVGVRDEVADSWSTLATHASGSSCEIDATRPANSYNGKWLKAEFDLFAA